MDENTAEKSYTIALLGANHELTKIIGESLGRPGTKSDLFFFNRLDKENNCIFTAVSPIGYPEKIKSLIQTCMLNRVHLLIIDAESGITSEIGEILVVMDIFATFYNTSFMAIIANINSKTEWRVYEIETKLNQFTANMKLKGIEIFKLREKGDLDTFKTKVAKIANSAKSLNIGYGKVLIDHVFPVKGIGTVILGLVHGDIKAGDMYELVPVKDKHKKIILRSIQKHDRDFKTAETGDRVGLNLKGVKPEEITRNTILAEPGKLRIAKEITITLHMSQFFKPNEGEISPNSTSLYHLISDLGITPIDIVGGDTIKPGKSGKLKIILEKPLPYDEFGLKGMICFFEPFEGKLRIVGYFHSA